VGMTPAAYRAKSRADGVTRQADYGSLPGNLLSRVAVTAE
jgi:hypothetical protein